MTRICHVVVLCLTFHGLLLATTLNTLIPLP